MVNLKALEKSLAKIEEVGKDELTFEANGVKLTFRTMLPDEEEIVDAYARLAYTLPMSEFDIPEVELQDIEQEALENEDDAERADPLQIVRHRLWLDRLRQATLGFVIVELDGQNLRGLQYIETGEVDDNGNQVSMLKHEAIRDFVARWTRPILTQMFGAYSELMDRVNLRASKLVQFKPADIEEELKRLRIRAEELERHKLLSDDPSLRTARIESEQQRAEEVNARQQVQMETLASMSEDRVQQAVPQTQPPQRTPQTSRLPPQRPQEPPAQQAAPQPQQEQPQDPRRVPPPLDGDSRFDPSDPDAALEAENRRQEILYRQQQERKRQQAEQAQQQPRKPIIQGKAVRPQQAPKGAVNLQEQQLREARNATNMVQQAPPPQQRTQQTPVRQGAKKVGGKDVPIYRQPTTTLERRGEQADVSQIQLDQGSSSRNPRFVGPGGNNE